MCGRFTQNLSFAELRRLADLVGQPRNLPPRYNIAPTTEIEVIRAAPGGPELVAMRWGLVPSWWKKPLQELPSNFNARVETLAEKPMFRAAFKSRRCVIPASGFYEWTGEPGDKTPHYFSAADGNPLALAGLWESWREPDAGETLLSAAIVVGPASDWMRPYHDRMPVMLEWRETAEWLQGRDPASLLARPRGVPLRQWIVSRKVNRAGFGDDDPGLIEPARERP